MVNLMIFHPTSSFFSVNREECTVKLLLINHYEQSAPFVLKQILFGYHIVNRRKKTSPTSSQARHGENFVTVKSRPIRH